MVGLVPRWQGAARFAAQLMLHVVDSQTKRLSGASAIAIGQGRWFVDGSQFAPCSGGLLLY
jgi:hypothetical protein